MLKIIKPSKQPLPPITMRNRLWSGSWCSDWRACCGGYDGQRPSRLVFSKSRRTISLTLEGRTKFRLPRVKWFMCFTTQTRIGKPHRTVSRTPPRRARLRDWLQPKARWLLMLSSRGVSCGSAICPIMLSTASVAMKPLFGVKPGRFYLRSTIWIATSRMRECDIRIGGEQACVHSLHPDLLTLNQRVQGSSPCAPTRYCRNISTLLSGIKIAI